MGTLLVPPSPAADALLAVHQQRFSMGTMFDIVVYHGSRPEAEAAIARAMDEISRLDRVMSHYRADSDLSRLVRDGRHAFVSVPASLYEVIERASMFSERSGGRFDITVAPLVNLWTAAAADGRRPAAGEIAAARRCVGVGLIELRPPDRIRLRSDCVELDLGGIGKGYAVDRALSVLRTAGVRRALVNAGGSSIAAIGAPPGRSGWPVALRSTASGSAMLVLRHASVSTSQQNGLPAGNGTGQAGEIIDPLNGAPAAAAGSVSVVAPHAIDSDALSTTLLMLSREDGSRLLDGFPAVSAVWMSADGSVAATYHAPPFARVTDR